MHDGSPTSALISGHQVFLLVNELMRSNSYAGLAIADRGKVRCLLPSVYKEPLRPLLHHQFLTHSHLRSSTPTSTAPFLLFPTRFCSGTLSCFTPCIMASHARSRTVGIVGAGHAGVPMAAMASQAGLKVYLYADPAHRGSNFNALLKQTYDEDMPWGEAVINSDGEVIGAFNVTLCFNLQTMVDECNELWNNLPEFAHDQLITDLERCNNLDKVLIGTVTANGFSLKARNRIHPRGFIDCAVSPTASRAVTGKSSVAGVKKGMFIGLFPKDLPDEVLVNYHKIYPGQKVVRLPNSFGALFVNTNLFIHPGPVIMGLVAAELKTPGLMFYRHCFAGRFGARLAGNVARAICELGKAYDIVVPEGVKLSTFFYDFPAESLSDFGKRLPAYNAQSFMPSAETMEKNRYLIEDPAVLNMLATLAQLVGVDPRPFRAVVDMAGMAINDHYQQTVDDLSGIDMKGFAKEGIMSAINETLDEWNGRWARGLEAQRQARAKAAKGPTLDEFLVSRRAEIQPLRDI